MKKIVRGVLLGALLCTTTSMSFAAGNENIEKKATACKEVKMGTAMQTKALKEVDLKNLTEAFEIEIEEGDFKKIGDTGIGVANLENLPSFKEYIKGMQEILKDINKTDLETLEDLYNQAVSLEKEKKFDESNKKWEAFNKLLEKYFKDEIILFSERIELGEDDLKEFENKNGEIEIINIEELPSFKDSVIAASRIVEIDESGFEK